MKTLPESIKFQRKEVYFIIGIFILSFIIRLIYLFQIKNHILFDYLELDFLFYHNWARDILHKSFIGSEIFSGMPLYPYFLALVYRLSGESLFWIRVIHFFLGSLTCVLVYLLARRVFTRPVAVISAFLFAFYGVCVFYEGQIISSTLTVFLITLSCYTIVLTEEKSSIGRWFSCGLLLGLFTLISAAGFLIGILLALLLFLKKKSKWAVALMVGTLLMIAPVTLRNYIVGKDFVPITFHGGINFYIGNNPKADGSFRPPQNLITTGAEELTNAARVIAEKNLGRRLNPSQVSNYWFSQGLEFIRHNFFAWLKLTGRKTLLFINYREIADIFSYYFFKKFTILKFPFLTFLAIGPLGLFGLFLAFKGGKARVVRVFTFGYALSIIMFFVNSRYRLPVVPFLCVFSGYGLWWMGKRLIEKNYREFSFAAVALILVFAVSQLRLFNQIFITEYNAMGTAYKNKGMYEKAEGTYKEAARLYPDFPATHCNLGNIYLNQHKYDEAIREYKKAVSLSPYLAKAYYNLGVLYLEKGELDSALEQFHECEKLYFTPPDLFLNMAQIYNRKKLFDEGIEQCKRALAIASSSQAPRIYHVLGNFYYSKGDFENAIIQYKKALENKPEFSDVLNNLGVVYFEQGKREEAIKIWESVLKIDPKNQAALGNLKKIKNRL